MYEDPTTRLLDPHIVGLIDISLNVVICGPLLKLFDENKQTRFVHYFRITCNPMFPWKNSRVVRPPWKAIEEEISTNQIIDHLLMMNQ